jgi:hypothetical protein
MPLSPQLVQAIDPEEVKRKLDARLKRVNDKREQESQNPEGRRRAEQVLQPRRASPPRSVLTPHLHRGVTKDSSLQMRTAMDVEEEGWRKQEEEASKCTELSCSKLAHATWRLSDIPWCPGRGSAPRRGARHPPY